MQSIVEILGIKASSAKNPELSECSSMKPGIGQNIAFQPLPNARKSTCRISVFPDLFFFQADFLRQKVTCVVNSGWYFYLWFGDLCGWLGVKRQAPCHQKVTLGWEGPRQFVRKCWSWLMSQLPRIPQHKQCLVSRISKYSEILNSKL